MENESTSWDALMQDLHPRLSKHLGDWPGSWSDLCPCSWVVFGA
jgi:hypothetical protein